MKKILFLFLITSLIGILVTGCSSQKYLSQSPSTSSAQNANTIEQQNSQIKTSTLKYPTLSALEGKEQTKQIEKDFKEIAKDIHFKFNSYALQPIHQYGINENPIQILNAIALFMKKYPNVKIRIEGNCDERGTIEYNLALGEKRALAAKQYLVSQGINPERIDVISYGKSRPLDPAHNPWAWAKNRRDHFVLIKK